MITHVGIGVLSSGMDLSPLHIGTSVLCVWFCSLTTANASNVFKDICNCVQTLYFLYIYM